MDKLLELAERCERAAGGNSDDEIWQTREISDAIHELQPEPKVVCAPDYCHSLDAAMTLVPVGWRLIDMCETVIEGDFPWYVRLREKRFDVSPGSAHSDGATPALALCAAALRARTTQGSSTDAK